MKQIIKRLTVCLLALCLLGCALVSCSSVNTPGEETTVAPAVSDETPTSGESTGEGTGEGIVTDQGSVTTAEPTTSEPTTAEPQPGEIGTGNGTYDTDNNWSDLY